MQAVADNGSTGNISSVLDTTNGITINNIASGFVAEQIAITNITTASPAVVTTTSAHGYASLDRVIITQVVGTMASQINNYEYVVNVLTSTTYALYDTYGNPINITGAYTSGGQSTLEGPQLGIVNAPMIYQLTLGSAVMGSNADVIYFRASKFNSYFQLGTV